jgi:hypothetical protein
MVSSGEQIHVKMWDLFYSLRSNLVINILTIVGFTLLMMIWNSFPLFGYHLGFEGVYDLMTHKEILLVCIKGVWSEQTNLHTWEILGEYRMWNQTISVSLGVSTEFFHFHWGLDLWAKSLVAANFCLHSCNKCFLPGVDIFWAPWNVDSYLSLTKQVQWTMWEDC